MIIIYNKFNNVCLKWLHIMTSFDGSLFSDRLEIVKAMSMKVLMGLEVCVGNSNH